MVGVKGRSGIGSADARARNRAARVAAVQAGMATDTELAADAAVEALDDGEHVIPRPSAELSAYADGEAERQLAWGRYLAAQARAIEVETKNRERIPIAEVRAWCARVIQHINKRLPTLQTWAESCPNASPEARAWLKAQAVEFDRTYREQIAREEIV